jgi:Spy/CpxP family protein refolding chaperone
MAQRPATPISLTPPPPEKPTGLSPGARQAIAIVALVLCLLIGGGIIYFFLHGPSNHIMKVDTAQQTIDANNRQAMRTPPRRPPAAITKDDDTTWTVMGASGAMRVRSVSGGGYKVVLYYPGRDMQLTHDQIALLSGIVRARRDEAMAKEWNITADQLDQLKKVDTGTGIQNSQQERTEMLSLWDAYMQAGNGQPKTDAEKKLIGRLDELAKANLDASRKALAQKLDDAKKILTPEQVDKITQH